MRRALRWLVVGVVTAVGCGPAPRRAAPPPIATSSARGDAIPTPAPASPAETPPPAAPPVTPPPTPPREILGLDCRGTRPDLDACRAMGPRCALSPLPEMPRPDRCANRGARCLDDLEPEPARAAPCWCTCSDRYRAVQRAADAEADRLREQRREDECIKELDVATGKPTGGCRPPRLPR